MQAMKPYLKIWYDGLEEGKLLGVRCKECGAVEFPPVPICNTCGGHGMEWMEVSGRAKVQSFTYSYMGIPPYFKDAIVQVQVKMEEGPEFASWIPDVDPSRQQELLEKLPFDVKAETTKLDEGVYWPIFRIDE